MSDKKDIRRIINARIVTPDDEVFGTAEINQGIITDIIPQEKNVSREDPCVFDARGAYLVPGGIDAHVHFGGFGPPKIADTFETGSRAALSGGTTTVMDFCESEAGESPEHCIDRRMKDAETSYCDYRFHFVLTKDYRRQLDQLDYLRSRGIRDYKLFTVYDNTDLTYDQIGDIFQTMKDDPPATFLVHAEDPEIIRQSEEKIRKSPHDEHDMLLHAVSRPARAEAEAVRKILQLASEHPVSVCIAHVSAGETLEIMDQVPPALSHDIEDGRSCRFLFESCPHYFEFQQDRLSGEEGNLFVMTPPLRKAEDSRRLWEGLSNGRISILSTDHCPYHIPDLTGKNWDQIPCGVDGTGIRMLYFYSEGVVKRGLSMRQYVRLTSENAARFYHLYPKKGAIAPGSDADLTLIDPEGQSLIHTGTDPLGCGIDHSIYEKKQLSGIITAVFKGGVLAFDGRDVLTKPGSGRYLG